MAVWLTGSHTTPYMLIDDAMQLLEALTTYTTGVIGASSGTWGVLVLWPSSAAAAEARTAEGGFWPALPF
jgi:hypothetical protein